MQSSLFMNSILKSVVLIPQHTHEAKNSMLAFQMGVKQHTKLLSASLVSNDEKIFF